MNSISRRFSTININLYICVCVYVFGWTIFLCVR